MRDELLAFLNARLDEDEQVAREAECYWHGVRVESATKAEEDHAIRHSPTRMLREVEAKRGILAGDPADQLLRLLVLPYSDHREFKSEWEVIAPEHGVIAPADFEKYVWDEHTADSPHDYLDPSGNAHVQWSLAGVPAWGCQAAGGTGQMCCEHITVAPTVPDRCGGCGAEDSMSAVYQTRQCLDPKHAPEEVAW